MHPLPCTPSFVVPSASYEHSAFSPQSFSAYRVCIAIRGKCTRARISCERVVHDQIVSIFCHRHQPSFLVCMPQRRNITGRWLNSSFTLSTLLFFVAFFRRQPHSSNPFSVASPGAFPIPAIRTVLLSFSLSLHAFRFFSSIPRFLFFHVLEAEIWPESTRLSALVETANRFRFLLLLSSPLARFSRCFFMRTFDACRGNINICCTMTR